ELGSLGKLQPVREIDTRKGLALHKGIAVIYRNTNSQVFPNSRPKGDRLRTGGIPDTRPLLPESRRYHGLSIHAYISGIIEIHMVHKIGDYPLLLGEQASAPHDKCT